MALTKRKRAAVEKVFYFSFYDFCEKMATVLGTLAFALINNYTQNMRSSVLALIIFFILAVFFIARIQNFKVKHP
jgi:UMF1 family MFS transporter